MAGAGVGYWMLEAIANVMIASCRAATYTSALKAHSVLLPSSVPRRVLVGNRLVTAKEPTRTPAVGTEQRSSKQRHPSFNESPSPVRSSRHQPGRCICCPGHGVLDGSKPN